MALNKAIKTVQTIEPHRDLQSKSAALVADTSTTIATILGTTVSTAARGVIVNITGTGSVHYNPTGAATTSSAILPATVSIFGSKTELDAVQFIGSSGDTPTVSIIVFGDK